MVQSHDLTFDEIEAAIARAREERAEAIRSGATSLALILRHFLADLRRTPLRA